MAWANMATTSAITLKNVFQRSLFSPYGRSFCWYSVFLSRRGFLAFSLSWSFADTTEKWQQTTTATMNMFRGIFMICWERVFPDTLKSRIEAKSAERRLIVHYDIVLYCSISTQRSSWMFSSRQISFKFPIKSQRFDITIQDVRFFAWCSWNLKLNVQDFKFFVVEMCTESCWNLRKSQIMEGSQSVS